MDNLTKRYSTKYRSSYEYYQDPIIILFAVRRYTIIE